MVEIVLPGYGHRYTRTDNDNLPRHTRQRHCRSLQIASRTAAGLNNHFRKKEKTVTEYFINIKSLNILSIHIIKSLQLIPVSDLFLSPRKLFVMLKRNVRTLYTRISHFKRCICLQKLTLNV